MFGRQERRALVHECRGATGWKETATRRVGFAIIPTGLAAVANSDIAAEDTFLRLPERACSDRAGSES